MTILTLFPTFNSGFWMYIKMLVYLILWCHMVTGRSYRNYYYGRPHNGGHEFHHSFEHHDMNQWHNGAPAWDPPFDFGHNNQQYQKYTRNFDELKQSWRLHHNSNWEYNWFSDMGLYSTTEDNRPITPPAPINMMQCMNSCPTTPEYNPVCGTNDITYSNPGRLECAKACGINVELKHRSKCPPPSPPSQTPPSTSESLQQVPQTIQPQLPEDPTSTTTRPRPTLTTSFPSVPPEMLNGPTTTLPPIPLDILNSIFTNPSIKPDSSLDTSNSQTTPNYVDNSEDSADIDIRGQDSRAVYEEY